MRNKQGLSTSIKWQDKFANIVLVGCIILLSVALILTGYKSKFHKAGTMNLYYLIFASDILLFAWALSWRKDIKANFSLLVVLIVFSIYMCELFLELQPILMPAKEPDIAKIARKKGIFFDAKTKLQVVEDLRKAGVEAYPIVFPSLFCKSNGLKMEGKNLFPLSGISNVTTVHGNESGKFLIYKSDEHGFNNPSGYYKDGRVDIALIGDSFTQGAGVDPSDNIAGHLINAGYNTINLCMGGVGPLMELAILKEYAEPLKPKIVLWFFMIMT